MCAARFVSALLPLSQRSHIANMQREFLVNVRCCSFSYALRLYRTALRAGLRCSGGMQRVAQACTAAIGAAGGGARGGGGAGTDSLRMRMTH